MHFMVFYTGSSWVSATFALNYGLLVCTMAGRKWLLGDPDCSSSMTLEKWVHRSHGQ